MLELQQADTRRRWRFASDSEAVTLGRAAENDLVLDNQHVSAWHGRIFRDGDGYRYQDLGSTNGSALERAGRRLALPAHRPSDKLRPGDLLLLGAASEPVGLQVLACSRGSGENADAAPAVTVLASLPLAANRELGRRLEERGESLAPFLELVQRLAAAEEVPAVAAELVEFISASLPGSPGLAVLPRSRPEALAQAGLDALPAPPAEPGAELRLLRHDATGCYQGWLRLGRAAEDELLLVAEWGERRPAESELDALALAGALARGRVEQLHLVAGLEQARAALDRKHRYLLRRARERAGDELLGRSPALEQLRAAIAKVALSDATVLITGPSGSGKELVARQLHRQSLRHEQLLAAVNCGALVEGLLEVELFGCRRGAYTGAVRDREGLFQVADGGTLFLDEVSEMSPALQVKLLRVLESGQVTPVGDNRPQRVDVRLVAASNQDLAELVRQGRFREDLFFRLNVFPIRVPPLAERREDIPLLAEHFLRRFCRQHGLALEGFSPEALELLCRRDYPGNVRQLANEVQRAVLLAAGGRQVEAAHLARETDEPAAGVVAAAPVTLKQRLAAVERQLLLQALAECGQNRTRAARRLGLSRQALGLKLKKLGIGATREYKEDDGGDEDDYR